MKRTIRLSENDLHRIVRESVNSLLRESEDGGIDDNVIDILEKLYEDGKLDDYFIENDEKKWVLLVKDILVGFFNYPFGSDTVEEAKRIYRERVIRWKEGHKITDMMGRTTFDFMNEDVLRNVVRNVINEVYGHADN